MFGYFTDNITTALTASLAGLVILYIPNTNDIFKMMMKMFLCSFGMILSCLFGLMFSFDIWIATIGFTIFSGIVHYVSKYFRLKPPASFFFIMIAAMMIGQPFNLEKIPTKLGIFAIGTIIATSVSILYCVLINPKHKNIGTKSFFKVNPYINIVESIIIGSCMGVSILVGKLFHLDYPFWIPISSLAVLQGVNKVHIWKRGFRRIIGTFAGLLIAWAIFSFFRNPLTVCIIIICLQIIIELLITRHYALTVVFLTPMGMLLAETGSPTSLDPDHLLKMRLIQILIGSAIGSIGGWFLYNEKLRFNTVKNLRKSRIALRRRFSKNY